MGEIVFGAGTSHSPMLLLDAADWREWAARGDASFTDLTDADGVVRTFEEWSEIRCADIEPQLDASVIEEKASRCGTATRTLAQRIVDARLDALVIIGDDQGEHLDASNLPPILIHHGASVANTVAPSPAGAPAIVQTVWSGYYEPDRDREYPIDVDLANDLIARLSDDGFDIATSARLPAERAEGHAFQYVHRHLAPPGLPTVLVLLNTYMPPAQPRARRCIELGAAIRAAVTAAPRPRRVGIIGSGGLSHFLVDEHLDQLVLGACAKGDTDALARIPEPVLQSGSSEIKNWMVVAAACAHLEFDLIDYVPGYRTPAGTGTGLAFATWAPPR